MLADVKEKIDKKEGFFKGAVNAAEQAAMVGEKVEKFRKTAASAIEDSIVDAKRTVKRGVYAAEDLIDDTAHRIKKDPLLSVALTFGVGLGIGAFLGWLVAYKSRPAREN